MRFVFVYGKIRAKLDGAEGSSSDTNINRSQGNLMNKKKKEKPFENMKTTTNSD